MGKILMRCFFLSLLIIMLPSVASAGYKEEFEREFLTKPWAGEQIEEDVCVQCHASDQMKPEFRNIADEWKASWHAQNKISCHHCHGGDSKDAAMSMSKQRGFVGTPVKDDIPDFCGKCHIGILKNYLESGHGKALKWMGTGPTCVTCHGSHDIQKANIDIINEQRCTKCHSYQRAKTMKQALFIVEKKIGEIDEELMRLKNEGVYTEDEAKILFSTQAEFRSLFHTVDVNLVKERTDDFTKKLSLIEKEIQDTFDDLHNRKNFSTFMMLLFAGMGITLFIISKVPKK